MEWLNCIKIKRWVANLKKIKVRWRNFRTMERKYTCLFYLNFHFRITETRTFYTFRLQINKKIIWRRNNLVCGIEFKLWLENCISNWHVARLYTYIHYTHFRTSPALIVLSRIRSASYSLCNAKHEKVITSIDSVNNYFVSWLFVEIQIR